MTAARGIGAHQIGHPSGGVWGAAAYAITATIGAFINANERAEKAALERAKEFRDKYTQTLEETKEKSTKVIA